jgi:4-hydroxybenzoate polyprenyltransferase
MKKWKNNFGKYLLAYIQLFRVPHYIKNLLLFVPLCFGLGFFDITKITVVVMGFVAFSLLASAVYIVNDLKDIEKDRQHSVKRFRSLASGNLSTKSAIVSLFVLFVLFIIITVFCIAPNCQENLTAIISLVLLYTLLNIGYSFGLKDIPILDIIILASGYVIRILFGALLTNVTVSAWLYLTVTTGAFYLGFGKRRNEIIKSEQGTRTSLKLYTQNFLDKNMYMCQTLCLVFYALWSIDKATIERLHTGNFIYTTPLVLVILLKYSLNIEADSDGDPTTVILHDKIIIFLILLYGAVSFLMITIGMERG